MLDEPSLGLSPLLSNEVFALIGQLNRENGQSILLVEQNTHRALELAHRAYVLELGRVAMEGPPERILADRTLQDAYLGQGDEPAGAPGAQFRQAEPHRKELNADEPEQRRSTMKTRLTGAILAAALAALWAGSAAAQDILLGYLPSAPGPSRPSRRPTRSRRRSPSTRSTPPAASPARSFASSSFDTAGKPDQAVVGLRKLAEDDKVLAIIGPFSSSECRVVFPAGDRAGVATHVDGLLGAEARRAVHNSRSATRPTRATCSSA